MGVPVLVSRAYVLNAAAIPSQSRPIGSTGARTSTVIPCVSHGSSKRTSVGRVFSMLRSTVTVPPASTSILSNTARSLRPRDSAPIVTGNATGPAATRSRAPTYHHGSSAHVGSGGVTQSTLATCSSPDTPPSDSVPPLPPRTTSSPSVTVALVPSKFSKVIACDASSQVVRSAGQNSCVTTPSLSRVTHLSAMRSVPSVRAELAPSPGGKTASGPHASADEPEGDDDGGDAPTRSASGEHATSATMASVAIRARLPSTSGRRDARRRKRDTVARSVDVVTSVSTNDGPDPSRAILRWSTRPARSTGRSRLVHRHDPSRRDGLGPGPAQALDQSEDLVGGQERHHAARQVAQEHQAQALTQHRPSIHARSARVRLRLDTNRCRSLAMCAGGRKGSRVTSLLSSGQGTRRPPQRQDTDEPLVPLPP